MKDYPISTTGVLCESRFLSIGWPEPCEFDPITVLRNKPGVRKWFLNDRTIDIDANRVWLETGMDRPKEALLSIRLKGDGSFLGTIGWSDWDLGQATAWFGRIAVDFGGLKKAARHFPRTYPGVALEATSILRDFAFQSMRLEQIFTYFIDGNVFAERVNRSVGMLHVSRGTRIRADNTTAETVEMYMDRQRWALLYGKPLRMMR